MRLVRHFCATNWRKRRRQPLHDLQRFDLVRLRALFRLDEHETTSMVDAFEESLGVHFQWVLHVDDFGV